MATFKTLDEIFTGIKTSINAVIPTFLFKVNSVIHTLAMSFSMAIEDLHVEAEDILTNIHLSTAFGPGLDLIGADFAIPRVEATKSKRTFRFTRNVAATQDYTIPAGKRVGTTVDVFGNRKVFTVLFTAAITTGNTFVDVLCEAEADGADSNIPPGTLVEIIDAVPGVDSLSVIVDAADEDAVDREEDEVYRQRIIDNFKNNAQGTIAALQTIAAGVPGVLDAIVTESGTNDGIVTVFATDGTALSGATAAALEAALEAAAAAGIDIVVQPLNSIDVVVVVEVAIDPGYDNSQKAIIADSIVQNINSYVESLERGVDDLIYNKILAAISNAINVEDVISLTVNGGTANIASAPTSVFRVITAPDITLTEV